MTDLIGIATWNFGGVPLAERIDRFAAMGYNAVSLNTLDAAPMARGQMPDVEEAIQRNRLPITIHGGLGPKGESIPRASILSDFAAYTDWQARTGLLVTVNYDVAKRQPASGGSEFRCDEMRDVLREMLSISDGAGFTVGIEDWPRCQEHLHSIEDLRRFPHYGMLIDLGHLNMRTAKSDDPERPFSEATAREYLERMVLPVNELHVHNNDGVKDLHAPPDVGTADYPILAELLLSTGKLSGREFRRVSTIEIVPAWCGLNPGDGWSAAQRALPYWRDITPSH